MNDQQRRQAFNRAWNALLKQRASNITESTEHLSKLLSAALDDIVLLLMGQPTDYQRWYLPQIQQQIEAVLTGLEQQASPYLHSQLNAASAAGGSMLDNALKPAGIQVVGLAPFMDTTLLENIKRFHVGRIKDITRTLASNIELTLTKVVLGQHSPYDAIKDIKGAMDAPMHRIKTIVLTSVSSVFSNASFQRLVQMSEYMPGLRKQWNKSGKRHPRLTHAAAHRQHVPVKAPFMIGTVKMMHPHDPKAPAGEVIRCGCYLRPYMANWEVKAPLRKSDQTVS